MFELDPDRHHSLGILLNNLVWELLAKPVRTPVEDKKMRAAAHGSLYHWHRSPKFQPINAARGHWMISRVHAILKEPQAALEHARHCLEIVEETGAKDFDLAYAYEGLARAHAAAGQLSDARQLRDRARSVPIAKEDDRRYFEQDLASEPWFGV